MVDISMNEKYAKLDYFNIVEFKMYQSEYFPKYLETSKEIFLRIWGCDLSYQDVNILKQQYRLNKICLIFILNFLTVDAFSKQMKILFTVVDITNADPSQLEYQQIDEASGLLIKDHQIQNHDYLMVFFNNKEKYFLVIVCINQKQILMIDFGRTAQDKTISDNLDLAIDIIMDLYDLEISQFEMKAKCSNFELKYQHKCELYYIDYIDKFIFSNGDSAKPVIEEDFPTIKDRILFLFFKFKHSGDQILKKYQQITDQIFQEQEERLLYEKETGLVNFDPNLPDLNKYDPIVNEYLKEKYKLTIPIDLKTKFKQNFDLTITYLEVEQLINRGLMEDNLYYFLMNYLLYINHNFQLKKICVILGRILNEEQKDIKLTKYNINYPTYVQKQKTEGRLMVPDVSKFKFLIIMFKYKFKWVGHMLDVEKQQVLIVDFHHNEQKLDLKTISSHLIQFYKQELNIDIQKIPVKAKIDKESKQFKNDSSIYNFFFFYKFITNKDDKYTLIHFSENEKVQQKEEITYLIFQLQLGQYDIHSEYNQKIMYIQKHPEKLQVPGKENEPEKPNFLHKDENPRENLLEEEQQPQPQQMQEEQKQDPKQQVQEDQKESQKDPQKQIPQQDQESQPQKKTQMENQQYQTPQNKKTLEQKIQEVQQQQKKKPTMIDNQQQLDQQPYEQQQQLDQQQYEQQQYDNEEEIRSQHSRKSQTSIVINKSQIFVQDQQENIPKRQTFIKPNKIESREPQERIYYKIDDVQMQQQQTDYTISQGADPYQNQYNQFFQDTNKKIKHHSQSQQQIQLPLPQPFSEDLFMPRRNTQDPLNKLINTALFSLQQQTPNQISQAKQKQNQFANNPTLEDEYSNFAFKRYQFPTEPKYKENLREIQNAQRKLQDVLDFIQKKDPNLLHEHLSKNSQIFQNVQQLKYSYTQDQKKQKSAESQFDPFNSQQQQPIAQPVYDKKLVDSIDNLLQIQTQINVNQKLKKQNLENSRLSLYQNTQNNNEKNQDTNKPQYQQNDPKIYKVDKFNFKITNKEYLDFTMISELTDQLTNYFIFKTDQIKPKQSKNFVTKTQFYKQLKQSIVNQDFSNLSNFLPQNANIFELQNLVIPISNLPIQGYDIAVINFINKAVTYYQLNVQQLISNFFDNIMQFLTQYHRNTLFKDMTIKLWNQQTNKQFLNSDTKQNNVQMLQIIQTIQKGGANFSSDRLNETKTIFHNFIEEDKHF